MSLPRERMPDLRHLLEHNFARLERRYRWYDQRWTSDEYLRHCLTGDTSW